MAAASPSSASTSLAAAASGRASRRAVVDHQPDFDLVLGRENGLVDIRGDLIAAVEEAKRLANLAPEDEVEIRLMVDDRSPFEVLSELMVSADGDGAAALAASLSGRGAEAEVLSALVGDRRAAAALQLAQALRADPRQLAIPVIVER
jgi:hypothetical protein